MADYEHVSLADRQGQRWSAGLLAAPRINISAFSYYSRLERLRDHVESNLAESLSLAEAARIVGLEKKYFSAFFRQKVGIPYTKWLNGVRIEAAVELLESKNHSISSVAAHVGFQDLRTFERVFKAATEMTPWDFKSLVRPA